MSQVKRNYQWFTVLWTTHPTYRSHNWPDGIWTRLSGSKKYRSQRAAAQALAAYWAQYPDCGFRIAFCEPPTPQQQRTRHEAFPPSAILFSTHHYPHEP